MRTRGREAGRHAGYPQPRGHALVRYRRALTRNYDLHVGFGGGLLAWRETFDVGDTVRSEMAFWPPSRSAVQREVRFPPGTPLKTIRARSDELRASLRTQPAAGRHTLNHDAGRYLDQVESTLISFGDRRRELLPWLPRFGHLRTLALLAHLPTLNDWRYTCSKRPARSRTARVNFDSMPHAVPSSGRALLPARRPATTGWPGTSADAR